MTWQAITKAASGVACAVPAECTCRSAAHCHSTRPRQLEPSVGSALHAAVRRCVATLQADALLVRAKMAGVGAAVFRPRLALSSFTCDRSPIQRAGLLGVRAAACPFVTVAGSGPADDHLARAQFRDRSGALGAQTRFRVATERSPHGSRSCHRLWNLQLCRCRANARWGGAGSGRQHIAIDGGGQFAHKGLPHVRPIRRRG